MSNDAPSHKDEHCEGGLIPPPPSILDEYRLALVSDTTKHPAHWEDELEQRDRYETSDGKTYFVVSHKDSGSLNHLYSVSRITGDPLRFQSDRFDEHEKRISSTFKANLANGTSALVASSFDKTKTYIEKENVLPYQNQYAYNVEFKDGSYQTSCLKW